MSVTLRIIELAGMITLCLKMKNILTFLTKRGAKSLKDFAIPIVKPPPGSIWVQNSVGLTWMTTGYYDNELGPFVGINYPKFDIRFAPGSKWLVLDCDESPITDDYWWIDLVMIGSNGQTSGKIRIFSNRAAMQEWDPKYGRMKRIDE